MILPNGYKTQQLRRFNVRNRRHFDVSILTGGSLIFSKNRWRMAKTFSLYIVFARFDDPSNGLAVR